MVAEYDVGELERIADAALELNHEAASSSLSLTRANVALKQNETQIIATSLIDALTGVGNRRKLDEALVAEIARTRRMGGNLAVAMVDVDHFKRVNDRFGHGAGDEVLRTLAALLSAQSRPTDLVARYGGEEFVVLMPHTDLAQAGVVAERMRMALADKVIEPLPEPATASFGVAQLGPSEDGESLLARADRALYAAKEAGRDRVVAAAPRPRE